MQVPAFLKRLWSVPMAAVFAFAFLLGLIQLFFPGQNDFFFQDIQLAMLHTLSGSRTVSDEIVIVLIDEASYQALKLKPDASFRPFHAKLLSILKRAKVRVVGFDLVFVTPEASLDEKFAQAIKQSDNVIAGEITEKQTISALCTQFKALGSLITEDYWRIPRKVSYYPMATKQKAFSLELAELFYQKQERAHGKPAPTAVCWPGGNSFWLNYRYRPDYFPAISYAELLAADNERLADAQHTPLSFLYDKIVLVGYYQEQSTLPVLAENSWPGVYVHAYALENLLRHTELKKLDPGLTLFLIFIVLVIMTLLRQQKIKIIALGGPWLVLLGIFSGQYLLWSAFNLWLNLSAFIFSGIAYLILHSIVERIRNIRDMRDLRLKLKEFEQFGKNIRQSLTVQASQPEVETLREVLVDNIFHDIKNYVANIETCIKLMSDRYASDKNLSRKIDIIRIACKNIECLSKNILDVKRLEEGRAKLNDTVCSYEKVLAIAHELVRDPICEIKNLKIDLQVYDRDFTFQADINFLERILHNLFNNAFKYSTPGGEVRLTCEATGSEIIISLFNTSTPLNDEQKLRVFEKYYQVPKASATIPAAVHAHSQGLGLYFCRLVQDAQHGRIWAENDQAGNYFKLGFTSVTRSGI